MKSYYFEITTNNLKNLDLTLDDNSITVIHGPNGCGKSSLAIDTIYKISEDELSQLLNNKDYISDYTILGYKDIYPSVCLQQTNYNKNPRSTIATYFGIDVFFKQLFSINNNVSPSLFQFNSYANSCRNCSGTGTEYRVDSRKILERNIPIKEMPFKNWRNTNRDYYNQILLYCCHEHNIDVNKTFNEINKSQQDKLLFGKSEKKYKINYKSGNRKRVKTSNYIGSFKELEILYNTHKLTNSQKKYFSEIKCSECNGFRFSKKTLNYKLFDKSIGELYSLEISELINWFNTKLKKLNAGKKKDKYIIQKLLVVLKAFFSLNLGHLTLNRSIPSLSGGELQRLRIAKSTISPFTKFLFILDEPLSGLHPSEWGMIKKILTNIKKDNKVLLIEHNNYLDNMANDVLYLGPSGGKNGGSFVTKFPTKDKQVTNTFFKATNFIKISNETFNNIHCLSLKLPLGTITGVCGVSGSGKTSFLEGIIPLYMTNYIYVNQSPLMGNSYSFVATAIGVYDYIRKLYGTINKVPDNLFVLNGLGGCKSCSGKGFIEEDNSFVTEKIKCPKCNGEKFNSKALQYKYNGFNIYQFLNLTISEIIELLLLEKSSEIKNRLNFLNKIGLDYLTLFQSTGTLSGGEAQRLKFAREYFKRKNCDFFILDEPFKGIDQNIRDDIISFFYELISKGKTIIFSEHDPIALSYCSYLIEFGDGAGSQGGKVLFVGEKEKIKNSKRSTTKKYIF